MNESARVWFTGAWKMSSASPFMTWQTHKTDAPTSRMRPPTNLQQLFEGDVTLLPPPVMKSAHAGMYLASDGRHSVTSDDVEQGMSGIFGKTGGQGRIRGKGRSGISPITLPIP